MQLGLSAVPARPRVAGPREVKRRWLPFGSEVCQITVGRGEKEDDMAEDEREVADGVHDAHGADVARLPVPLSDRRPALRQSGVALPDPAAALVRAVSGAPLVAPVVAAAVVGATAAAVVSGSRRRRGGCGLGSLAERGARPRRRPRRAGSARVYTSATPTSRCTGRWADSRPGSDRRQSPLRTARPVPRLGAGWCSTGRSRTPAPGRARRPRCRTSTLFGAPWCLPERVVRHAPQHSPRRGHNRMFAGSP